jgi:hypothetical protein
MTDVPDHYRLLGLSRLATPREIDEAARRLAGPLDACADPARQIRQQAAQAAAAVLRDPARRRAYDQWLSEQPDTRPPAVRARDEERAQTLRYARGARRLLRVLLVFSLLLGLDWALPLREYPDEPVMAQVPVSVGASLSDPQMAYDFRTPHTAFRLHSRQKALLPATDRVTVGRSPLLRVTRRVSAAGQPARWVRPYDGAIYNTGFVGAPALLLLGTGLGLLPGIRPELRLNLAVLSSLLALLTLGILLFC